MSLAPGTRLGAYEIVALIGAGGMGEVYRARDTRLGRDVAIKVLPDGFARDADRLARFKREAQVLASLNHPHIAAIYGLETTPEGSALVLELVDGPTLADRIAQGPLPLDEALPIAKQIIDALETAHEQGIVHRDLKPANIKLTTSGTVKVLDFGLARAVDTGSVRLEAHLSGSPTITSPAMTMRGVILGTAAYMSPEQARGRVVDRRTDIWAFGCVLYEMLAGRRLYDGNEVTDVLARVLERDVDLSTIEARAPVAVRRLLRRCLTKDLKRRLPNIGVARLEIEDAATGADVQEPRNRSASRREWIAWSLAAIALLAAIMTSIVPLRSRPRVDPSPAWLSVLPPHGRFGLRPSPTLSPDGTQIAFWAPDAAGIIQLWVRSVDSPIARALPGTVLGKEQGAETTLAVQPFWSPDGRSLGFFADKKLKRVDIGGGTTQSIADAVNPRGGSWNRDDVILFTPAPGSGLHRISAAGGNAAPLYSPDARPKTLMAWPHFLPDGHHFLFVLASSAAGGGIHVGDVRSTEIRRVSSVNSRAEYAGGRIFFGQNGELFSQVFDLGRLETDGEPVRVLDALGSNWGDSYNFAFSTTNQHLVSWNGPPTPVTQLTWYDRNGIRAEPVGPAGSYIGFDLSPDAHHAAVERYDLKTNRVDIWLIQLASGIASLFARPGPDGMGVSTPLWRPPDGDRILFTQWDSNLYLQSARGGKPEPIPIGNAGKWITSFSWDGQYVLFSEENGETLTDIGVLPFSDDRKVRQFLATPSNESQGEFSRDGRFVAYASDELGIYDIYIQSFPASGNKVRVSNGGGLWPKWRTDGRELFYLSPDWKMMAASVNSSGSTIQVSPPRILFVAPLTADDGARDQYTSSERGDRFLFNARVESAHPPAVTILLDWPARLQQ